MEAVLVDSSVWVRHFRLRDPVLVALLLSDRVLTHPMVVAELACGTPPAPRLQTLDHIALLKNAAHPSMTELRALIERERLYGLGCGVVDLTLLAAAMLTPGASLWTLDKKLDALAERFEIRYRRAIH